MNVLVVGLGSIAQKHIAVLRATAGDLSIYALRSPGHTNIVPGVHNVYSINDLEVRPDFALISNPTYRHAEAIDQTLRLGCPLFIEKPVLHDLSASSALGEKIRSNGILTYIACNLRFHPAIQFVRDYLRNRAPAINEVNIYCGSYLPEWRPGRDFRTIYSALPAMGGGAHLDLIHELDYCYWLFGKPRQVHSLKRNVSTLHIAAVDSVHYSLQYDTYVANIDLNYFRRDSRRDMEIVLEEGTLKVDILSCTVRNLTSRELLFEREFHMNDTYNEQMKYFVDHMTMKQSPMNDYFEAVDILKVALA